MIFLITVLHQYLHFISSDTTTRLTTVEGDVAEQDDRLTSIENSVDLWDDRIIALEVSNTDITERFTTVEEAILSTQGT